MSAAIYSKSIQVLDVRSQPWTCTPSSCPAADNLFPLGLREGVFNLVANLKEVDVESINGAEVEKKFSPAALLKVET